MFGTPVKSQSSREDNKQIARGKISSCKRIPAVDNPLGDEDQEATYRQQHSRFQQIPTPPWLSPCLCASGKKSCQSHYNRNEPERVFRITLERCLHRIQE